MSEAIQVKVRDVTFYVIGHGFHKSNPGVTQGDPDSCVAPEDAYWDTYDIKMGEDEDQPDITEILDADVVEEAVEQSLKIMEAA